MVGTVSSWSMIGGALALRNAHACEGKLEIYGLGYTGGSGGLSK